MIWDFWCIGFVEIQRGEKMRLLKVLTLICLLAVGFVLSGCTGSSSSYTTPPENYSLRDAGKIDLKGIDMGKLEKNKIDNVLGVSLARYGEGYEIKYRYLNGNIIVKICKFNSPSRGDAFWKKWVRNGNFSTTTQNGVSIVTFQTKRYSVTAWQKDSWFTYIGVPTDIANDKELLKQIREYINYRYQKL